MIVLSDCNKPIKLWTDGVPVEEEALVQLRNLANLPFIYKHIAVMPDVHAGCGSTIGSVIPTKNVIIPATVGVDLGCGMCAVKTSLTARDLPDNLFALRCAIEKAVPHGREFTGNRDKGSWGEPPIQILQAFESLQEGFNKIVDKTPSLIKTNNIAHLGTLGTGNHFIEICLDESQNVWIMLHSGSRGVGNAIGSHYIALAKKEMEKWMINLPDKDLAYLPHNTEHFNNYMEAVSWAQKFASINREVMMHTTINILKKFTKPFLSDVLAINCHHNYVAMENHFGSNVYITRKGAVRARKGDYGIIPGSMGAKSFIVRGLGNNESFHSCSHGAGRVMSRTKARALVTLDEHIKDTNGVECRKDDSVLDETPKAYKDIDKVMEAQKDLVEIVYTLKQVLCVKG